jgi:hypothetical protein
MFGDDALGFDAKRCACRFVVFSRTSHLTVY